MTNKMFILNDLESDDFLDIDIKQIKKALKKEKYQKLLLSKFINYDIIDNFYDDVLI